MKTLLEIFPRASKSFQEVNPVSSGRDTHKNDLQATAGGKKRSSMNKTETEFALILEAMKRKGEILRWEYEGITLRWAEIRYTPDFVVFFPHYIQQVTGFPPDPELDNPIERMKLIEVKGSFIGGKFERAIERFRHARTYWSEFQFEMIQKKNGTWTRIH